LIAGCNQPSARAVQADPERIVIPEPFRHSTPKVLAIPQERHFTLCKAAV
jgi:hypothetical protein